MKLQSLERYLQNPDPKIRAVLVHGTDEGLVRERAAALARSVVPDPKDPFRIAEMSGAALARDPALLADEAAALAFGGGRRVVRVRDAGNESAPACALLLDDPKGDALVLVEAGELSGTSALRRLFEGAANAAALACYPDDAQSLAGLIQSTLRRDGIEIAPDALDYLVTHLGSDRMVTLNELEKLALYIGGKGRATLADATACVGDSAALSLDDVAFATASGDLARLVQSIEHARAAGEGPVPMLRAVSRHFLRLHLVAGRIAAGAPADTATRGLRPPVFWKRQDEFRAQAQRWPEAWLGAAVDRLLQAEIDCKTTGMPDAALASRVLIEIARAAGRR